MTFHEFVLAANNQTSKQRQGQAYFNLLVEAQPSLAAQIRGTDLDPFHDEARIPAFLQHVRDKWPK